MNKKVIVIITLTKLLNLCKKKIDGRDVFYPSSRFFKIPLQTKESFQSINFHVKGGRFSFRSNEYTTNGPHFLRIPRHMKALYMCNRQTMYNISAGGISSFWTGGFLIYSYWLAHWNLVDHVSKMYFFSLLVIVAMHDTREAII